MGIVQEKRAGAPQPEVKDTDYGAQYVTAATEKPVSGDGNATGDAPGKEAPEKGAPEKVAQAPKKPAGKRPSAKKPKE